MFLPANRYKSIKSQLIIVPYRCLCRLIDDTIPVFRMAFNEIGDPRAKFVWIVGGEMAHTCLRVFTQIVYFQLYTDMKFIISVT